jgi:hypothetical protein
VGDEGWAIEDDVEEEDEEGGEAGVATLARQRDFMGNLWV